MKALTWLRHRIEVALGGEHGPFVLVPRKGGGYVVRCQWCGAYLKRRT